MRDCARKLALCTPQRCIFQTLRPTSIYRYLTKVYKDMRSFRLDPSFRPDLCLISALMHSAKTKCSQTVSRDDIRTLEIKTTIVVSRIADSPSDSAWQPSISAHRSAAFGAPSNSLSSRATREWMAKSPPISYPGCSSGKTLRQVFYRAEVVDDRERCIGARIIESSSQAADIKPVLGTG